MKTVLGNFLTQENKDFPLDCELLDNLQNNQFLISVLGNVAGDKAILFGCELSGTERKEGYVFLRTLAHPEGEVLYFEGGRESAGLCLNLEPKAVSVDGYEYPQAYTARTLAAGAGEEKFVWSDFKYIKSVQQLERELDKERLDKDAKIAAITPPPIGIVQMWAGNVTADSIPDNYMLCDGSTLLQSEYPQLYASIGRLHTAAAVASGYFCLPDLRSRFIAGYNSADVDHAIGKSGGEKNIKLLTNHLPPHAHSLKDYYFTEVTGNNAFSGSDNIYPTRIQGSGHTDNDNYYMHYRIHDTELSKGGGEAYKYMPQYYTLAYIMRFK